MPALLVVLAKANMVGLPETDGPGEILSDAWDYKGRPAIRSRSGGWTSAAMILGMCSISESIASVFVSSCMFFVVCD